MDLLLLQQERQGCEPKHRGGMTLAIEWGGEQGESEERARSLSFRFTYIDQARE